MKIALIGLPNSGKTTVFNALTRQHAEVTAYANTKTEPNLAVVSVGDERVGRLSDMYHPKKTIYATIEFIDFVGLSGGFAQEGTLSNSAMQLMKTSDALALVVRNFPDDLMGEASPLQDMEKVHEELLLADLIVAETRLERIEKSLKKGLRTPELQVEETALKKVAEHVNDMKPIRDLELNLDEEKSIRGFRFLTQKPFMVIVNSDENTFGKSHDFMPMMAEKYPVIEFAGRYEMELAQLDDPADLQMFMDDIGIRESARDRLTQLAYKILGYISFFTVGQDEVRAWNICAGDTALEAAAAIHSDLARGFIRAECFHFDDLSELGSEKGVKEKGRFRLEGKDYHVKDGDILHIRFNV
jgi:GTP-binding protein YchF